MEYTPLKQLFTVAEHKRGDCWRTAIACVLKLNSPEDVPLFPGDISWWPETLKWLDERGYYVQIFNIGDEDFPNGVYIQNGISPRTRPETGEPIRHSCVGLNGKVVHDPHPENNGLIELQECIFIIPNNNG